MTRWYIKGGDSAVIASGSADFDFVPASTIRPGDTFIARVATRDNVTPAPVTSGDWTSITSSPDASNSTSGSDAALSKDFVWYTTFTDAKDLTWSRGGTAVQLRGAFAVAPAMGYEIELVASSSGTNASGSTASVLTSLTTAEDDELIVCFGSSGRNTSWTNWDAATDPSVASGSGGSSQIGLFSPTSTWQRHQSNGSTSGSDISGSIGVAVKDTAGSTGNIQVTTGVGVRLAWVTTRWRQVQATTLKVVNNGGGGVYPGTGDTNAAALPFTPTSGNTLFAFVAIDKDATSDVTATGWTREMQERSGSAVSAALFRKVSDGTETEIEVTYTSSASQGFSLFVVEIEGEVEIDVSATSTTNLSTPAKTSGTATTANTTAAGGLAIGLWANDSYGSCDTGTLETWSDGFIANPGPKTRQYFGPADVGSPAIAVGWKEIPSSGTAVSTSYTYTGDTDDENLLFLVVLKESASGVTGDAAITLGNVTTAADGTPEIIGDAAITLGNVTTAADGWQPALGDAAITLGLVTTAADGTPEIIGDAAPTLGLVTTSADGAPEVIGDSAVTLGLVTTAADGTPEVTGDLAKTLGLVTTAADGTPEIVGDAAITLGLVTTATDGAPEIIGDAAITLQLMTLETQTLSEVSGDAAITMPLLTTEADGTPEIIGDAAPTLGLVTLSADGEASAGTIEGDAAITLGLVTTDTYGYPGDAPRVGGGGGGRPSKKKRRKRPKYEHEIEEEAEEEAESAKTTEPEIRPEIVPSSEVDFPAAAAGLPAPDLDLDQRQPAPPITVDRSNRGPLRVRRENEQVRAFISQVRAKAAEERARREYEAALDDDDDALLLLL
jgi:hypothetical protein